MSGQRRSHEKLFIPKTSFYFLSGQRPEPPKTFHPKNVPILSFGLAPVEF
jgi:hypothetical protein